MICTQHHVSPHRLLNNHNIVHTHTHIPRCVETLPSSLETFGCPEMGAALLRSSTVMSVEEKTSLRLCRCRFRMLLPLQTQKYFS